MFNDSSTLINVSHTYQPANFAQNGNNIPGHHTSSFANHLEAYSSSSNNQQSTTSGHQGPRMPVTEIPTRETGHQGPRMPVTEIPTRETGHQGPRMPVTEIPTRETGHQGPRMPVTEIPTRETGHQGPRMPVTEIPTHENGEQASGTQPPGVRHGVNYGDRETHQNMLANWAAQRGIRGNAEQILNEFVRQPKLYESLMRQSGVAQQDIQFFLDTARYHAGHVN